MAKNGIKVLVDNMKAVADGIALLTSTSVMVGVPSDKGLRKDDEGPITNAALAYIHENGAPEVGIPARPFMRPGIRDAQKAITAGLRVAGKLALDGAGAAKVSRQLGIVGMKARDAIKAKIQSNIPPPLKLGTVMGRINRRKGKKYRADKKAAVDKNLAAGADPGAGLFVPLIDTGQLRNSISYVLRKAGRK